MNSKEKLRSILIDINPDIDYEKETELVDKGVFDSLEIMSLVMEITDQFDVELDPDDIIPENFNSIDMMLKLIEKH